MSESNVGAALSPEELPSLDGLDAAIPEEGAGAWPPGWYDATIIAGYTTRKGTVFETTDSASKGGDSRNLLIALDVSGEFYVPSSTNPKERVRSKGPGGQRNMFTRLNYRAADITPERVAQAKDILSRLKNGYKPSKSEQALYLSLGRVSQLEKALGFRLARAGNRFVTGPMVRQQVQIRVTINDESGYNEIAAFAQLGSHPKKA